MSESLKIIDAYPQPEEAAAKRPQCEAALNPALVEKIERWEVWRGKSWYRFAKPKPKGTCNCKARYLIKGKWYCRKHAGLIALDTIAEARK